MARAPGGRDNLFGLDASGVGALLREANGALLERRDALLAAAERVPDPLPDADAAARAHRFAGQVATALKAARDAKMGDLAPLREAGKAADAFFEEVNTPLKRLASRLQRLLDRAAAPPEPETPVAEAPGTPGAVAEAAPPAVAPSPPPAADLPTVWTTGSINRAALDLEALRDHFTDHELDLCVARLLKARGPVAVAGVTWKRTVRTPGAAGGETGY